MQKVASVKGQRKTERKGPTNEIENGQGQKKKKKKKRKKKENEKRKRKKKKKKEKRSKFWLMRMTVIEVLINFVPNPRKIFPFSKKKAFL